MQFGSDSPIFAELRKFNENRKYYFRNSMKIRSSDNVLVNADCYVFCLKHPVYLLVPDFSDFGIIAIYLSKLS